ncbi:J domain-containing protein [Paenibacillus alba]|uniref:J domain-containing protein n=1 Tax=Paenibacillus alba TaxID=1197127 RepID=UPI0015633747|nr:J domain-containing protein [Paenibacillus alba]NQX66881.1 J domain-containing protein [Paenibacillus alba]
MKTYYELLEIEPQATVDEIKMAYKRLAKRHHPDANAGSKQSEMMFKLVNEAYQTLSNAAARASYDTGMKAKREEQVRSQPASVSPMGGVMSRQPQTNRDAAKVFEAYFGIKRK